MINSGRLARAECARRAWGRAQRCTRDATRGMESPNCPEAASPDEAGGANSAAPLCRQLAEHLGGCADPDMALNNLERFVAGSRSPLSVGTLFERDPQTLPTMLQIFSTSQHLSDLLMTDPQSLDLLL